MWHFSLERWIDGSTDTHRHPGDNLYFWQKSKQYLQLHQKFFLFTTTICLILVVLSGIRFLQYYHILGSNGKPSYEFMVAKGCGIAINGLAMLLIMLMTRPLVTQVRISWWHSILPVDQHVQLHKYAGGLLFILASVHTLVHLLNIQKNLAGGQYHRWAIYNNVTYEKNMTFSFGQWLLSTQPGMGGLFPGLANPTGVVLVLTCLVMGVGAHPKIRQSGHFELFYWSHILYILFFALLILHCRQAVYWLSGPLLLFLAGKIKMAKGWLDGRGKTYVICGTLLPSQVTQLSIKRPDKMHFRPGDWLFINVPTISAYEWHPFTISSAPEQKDFLTLHIRSLGGWTGKLHAYFREESRLLRIGNVRSFMTILYTK